jgi:ankyrin repeat protein
MNFMKKLGASLLVITTFTTFAMQLPPESIVTTSLAPTQDQINEFFNAISAQNTDKVTSMLTASKLLRDATNEYGTAVQAAAGTGNLDLVKIFIRNNANINTAPNYGITPLMWALIHHNNKNLILYLIDAPNINLNAKDMSGQSALDYVGFSGALSDQDKAEITQVLKDKGAK